MKKIILIAACLSVFFEALDVSIVALAIPSIKSAFSVTTEKLEWLQTIYVLFYGGFMILGGRLSDVIGRKKIYVIGSILFGVSSLAAGFCETIQQLIFVRSIQGIGAAFAIPAAISIITNLFDTDEERHKALGMFGSFAALGFASGLMVGGVVVNLLSWKWIFWMNVPIIFLVIVFAMRFLPADKIKHSNKIDIIGGALLTASLICFTYAIHILSTTFSTSQILLSFATVVILLVAFYVWEKRHANPLLNFALLRDKHLRRTNFAGLMLGASFLSYVTFLSIYMQSVLKFTTANTGLLLFPFSICSAIIANFLLPVLQKKLSIRSIAILGYLFLAAGSISLIAACLTGASAFLLLSVFCVNAVAISIIYPSITAMSVQYANKKDHGVISGIQSTCYSAGCGIGLAVIWSIVRFLNNNENTLTNNSVITGMVVISVFCSLAVISIKTEYENTHLNSSR